MAFNKPFEVRPNSGSLFKNERKTDPNDPKMPDSTGQGLIECPHCGKSWTSWISAWRKESKKDGRKFLSLAFQEKKEQGSDRRDDRAPPRRDDQRPSSYDDERGGGRRAGPDTRGSYRDKPIDDGSDIPFGWLIMVGGSLALLALGTAHGFIA